MLFTGRPFSERMLIAASLGYRAIEFWDWRDKDLELIARTAEREGLTIAAMSGNRKNTLIDPADRAALREEMNDVFDVARRLDCRNVMMLSDVLEADGSAAPKRNLTAEAKLESVVDGLRSLGPRAEASGVTLLLEPLNTVLDHRGCFLDSSAAGVEAVRRVASPRVKLLYDIYHMSMMGEDVVASIERNLEWIGYIHVADMPGRYQPGSGTIDFSAINHLLNRVSYSGFVGLEYSALGPEEPAARAPLEVFG